MKTERLCLKKSPKVGLSMKNDVILNKVNVIECCIGRVQKVYADNPESLNDFTKQDSIVLNIQRACEASIDLAMHIVSEQRLGLPQTGREAFDMLQEASIIDGKASNRMKAMVGFGNIAIHDYQAINLEILQKIVEQHLKDFTDYTKQILASG